MLLVLQGNLRFIKLQYGYALKCCFFGKFYSERQMKEGNPGMQMPCKGLLESTGKPSSTTICSGYQ